MIPMIKKRTTAIYVFSIDKTVEIQIRNQKPFESTKILRRAVNEYVTSGLSSGKL